VQVVLRQVRVVAPPIAMGVPDTPVRVHVYVGVAAGTVAILLAGEVVHRRALDHEHQHNAAHDKNRGDRKVPREALG